MFCGQLDGRMNAGPFGVSDSEPQTLKVNVLEPCSRGLDSNPSSALLSGSGTAARLSNRSVP